MIGQHEALYAVIKIYSSPPLQLLYPAKLHKMKVMTIEGLQIHPVVSSKFL